MSAAWVGRVGQEDSKNVIQNDSGKEVSIYEDVSEDDSEEEIEKAVSEGHEDKSDHSTEIWAPRPMNSKEDSEDYF